MAARHKMQLFSRLAKISRSSTEKSKILPQIAQSY
jgi:hypothetical protein